jgi:uncharacterized protein (TIGR02246 family)
MARALPQLLLPVVMIAEACGRAGAGAATSARADTAQQAATPSVGRDSAQARGAVLRLEQELFQSYVRGDTAPSARILAADYVGITGDGHRETKAQALANLRRDGTTAAEAARDSIQVDSTTVRVFGDAAVAQTSGTFRTHDGRQRASVGFRNTDVFVWRDGRWQIVATHLSKVPETQGRASAP